MEKVKQVNFNSILTTLVLIVGFFGKHTLDQVETNVKSLSAVIMPRTEIESRLLERGEHLARVDAELLSIRSKIEVLEVDVLKLKLEKKQ